MPVTFRRSPTLRGSPKIGDRIRLITFDCWPAGSLATIVSSAYEPQGLLGVHFDTAHPTKSVIYKDPKSNGTDPCWWVDMDSAELINECGVLIHSAAEVEAAPACRCSMRDLASGPHPVTCAWYTWKRGQP